MDGGHAVAVLSRKPERASSVPELDGAQAVRADVTDPGSLTGALDDADAVVGAAQFPNHPVEVPRRGITYDRHDRAGTENLIAEAKRCGVRRFLYLSGAGADPASDKPWYRAKGRAEAALRGSGLEFCILRPSWCYGPEDRSLNRLELISRFSPVVPRLGVRPQRVQPVYVDDVALAVRRAFEREAAWNRTFEIGGPQEMTMTEIIETLLKVLGRRRVIVPIPTPLAKLATAPLSLLPSPPMTPQGIEFAVQDGLVDSRPLIEALEVRPGGLREGLSRYLGGAPEHRGAPSAGL